MPNSNCVPGCRSNCNYDGKRSSNFIFPKDAAKRTKWMSAIHHTDFVPGSSLHQPQDTDSSPDESDSSADFATAGKTKAPSTSKTGPFNWRAFELGEPGPSSGIFKPQTPYQPLHDDDDDKDSFHSGGSESSSSGVSEATTIDISSLKISHNLVSNPSPVRAAWPRFEPEDAAPKNRSTKIQSQRAQGASTSRDSGPRQVCAFSELLERLKNRRYPTASETCESLYDHLFARRNSPPRKNKRKPNSTQSTSHGGNAVMPYSGSKQLTLRMSSSRRPPLPYSRSPQIQPNRYIVKFFDNPRPSPMTNEGPEHGTSGTSEPPFILSSEYEVPLLHRGRPFNKVEIQRAVCELRKRQALSVVENRVKALNAEAANKGNAESGCESDDTNVEDDDY